MQQVLRLQLHLVTIPGETGQLRDAVHKECHIFAEFGLKILQSHRSVFHNVMQNTCNDGLLVHLQLCQNNRYMKRVNNIRIAGFSLLPAMRLIRNVICLLNHGHIIRRW